MLTNYIPIAKQIESILFDGEKEMSFHRLYMSAYKESFAHKKNGTTIYFSEGQNRIYQFSKQTKDYVIVAPTSYGKSELIIQKVADNISKNICIIVPTKSLLAQTRKNLIQNEKVQINKKKIVTHPDMIHDFSKNIIAVLTQERLLRLLQKYNMLSFDIVLIDEAHNLIEENEREVLLVQDLKILKNRNKETLFHFFTPFLVDPQVLKIFSKTDSLGVDKIEEYIKIERYYFCNLSDQNHTLKMYDQFLDVVLEEDTDTQYDDEFHFINHYASTKNIIYLNRPKSIEKFAKSINNKIEPNDKIRNVQNALKDFLHEDYNLIKTLENGVVYHHGSMPESIRLYVENAFTEIKSIKYIVTSSTLLQGVNIPAEKIFLLNVTKGNGYMSASQFRNLTGRICRFREIFHPHTNKLHLLEPEIFVIGSQYSRQGFNISKFLKDRVKDNKVIEDSIDNPLIKVNLPKTNLTEKEQQKVLEAAEYQENIEPGSSNVCEVRRVTSQIAQLCFKNNIHDFDIFENEDQLESNYGQYISTTFRPVDSSELLVDMIHNIFLENIKLNKNNGDNFTRLREKPARDFYSMFLMWRVEGLLYKQVINKFLWYWARREKESNPFIYVGTRWGEVSSPYKRGKTQLYVDLSKKTSSEKVNLAILRIKEEQDFIDFKLMPYVEVLNDLEFIEESFYDRIKYGTADVNMIRLLKEGVSIELAKVIISTYLHRISIEGELTIFDNDIVLEMQLNGENEILIFEMECHITPKETSNEQT